MTGTLVAAGPTWTPIGTGPLYLTIGASPVEIFAGSVPGANDRGIILSRPWAQYIPLSGTIYARAIAGTAGAFVQPFTATATAVGLDWQWEQNFAAGTNLGPGQVLQYQAPSATITQETAGVSSPVGVLPAPPLGGNNFAVVAGPDGSAYNLMFGMNYGNSPSLSNGDFVATSYPYPGRFTQSITMWIQATGTGAWAPPVAPSYIAFELDMSPDTGANYSLETCIDFYVTTAGTVNIGFSYGGDATAMNTWLNSYVVPFAAITTNGWYTITNTSYRAGNLTTDPAFSIQAVYNASGTLVGYFVRPQGVNGVNLANMAGPGTNLNQTDQCLVAYWQPGFAGDNLAVADIGWYLGSPNDSQRPSITNAYNAPGATHGVAYSYQITATNSPTSYSAQFPAGLSALSINTSTGAITGTPATAGTYQFVICAANANGVDAALINLVVA